MQCSRVPQHMKRGWDKKGGERSAVEGVVGGGAGKSCPQGSTLGKRTALIGDASMTHWRSSSMFKTIVLEIG